MAQAVALLAVNPAPYGYDNTQRRETVNGTCALSGGGTYATNGLPLTWNLGVLTTASQPAVAFFYSLAGGANTYQFDTVRNTLRIFNGGVELANNAAIPADSIGFEAEYVRGV